MAANTKNVSSIRLWAFEDAPQTFRQYASEKEMTRYVVHCPRILTVDMENNGTLPPLLAPICFSDLHQRNGETFQNLEDDVTEDPAFSEWGHPEVHVLDSGDFVVFFLDTKF